MAQIIVRKLRPRHSNQWTKQGSSAAHLALPVVCRSLEGWEAMGGSAERMKDSGLRCYPWGIASASPDAWPVSEKKGEKECSRLREPVKKGHVFEEKEEGWCDWSINLEKSFLRRMMRDQITQAFVVLRLVSTS